MSIDFVPNKNISFSEIKTFNHKGVKVDAIEGGNVLLTDGTYFLWAYPRAEIETYGIVKDGSEVISHNHYEGVMFTLYGCNDPVRIFEAIEDFFDIWILSEYDDEYSNIVSPRMLEP